METRNDASRHHRQSIRLKGYDYGQPGAYFVTICTRGRQCWFGDIKDGKLAPSLAGDIVLSTWQGLPERFPEVSLDAFVTMPNHVHGVIFIRASDDVNVGAQFIASDPGNQGVMNHAPTLGECVRAFKAVAARLIRKAGLEEFGWQRNYYEHVVRNEAELDRIRRYIYDNPLRWEQDEENPANIQGLKSSTPTRHPLKQTRKREAVKRYIQGYQEQPQTEEEFGWSDYVTLQAFAELPWEQEEE